jgi:hypothetical protein
MPTLPHVPPGTSTPAGARPAATSIRVVPAPTVAVPFVLGTTAAIDATSITRPSHTE